MARLTVAERAALPDRAFAYVDSSGKRRLPIGDAAHVRSALARFGQIDFESDEARTEARRRLLVAAKRFRIVPIGFIDAEVRAARAGSDTSTPTLPSGFVTLLMADIEGSTGLLAALGDDYATLLDEVRRVQRDALEQAGGIVVEARADDVFAAFASPCEAVLAAVAMQRALSERRWYGEHQVRVRVGVHSGYPTIRDGNYIGMAVHTTARVSAAAHGGQVLVSSDCKEALTGLHIDGVRLRSLGSHRLRGIPDDVNLHQVHADGVERSFPPLRV